METQSFDATTAAAAGAPRVGVLTHAGRGALPAPARRVALLLDADSSERRQLARELGARGFDVEATDDADAGVALALARSPALVVLELRLGARSGLEVLARLRPQLAAAKLIVLTSYGSVASAVHAMRLGATDYLCKPASPSELVRVADGEAANDVAAPVPFPAAPLGSPPPPAALTLDEAIWEYINRTIESAGSLSEAARRLGLWRQSLKRMVAKHRPAPARIAGPPAPRETRSTRAARRIFCRAAARRAPHPGPLPGGPGRG
jgi:two-component system, response regulator RegA